MNDRTRGWFMEEISEDSSIESLESYLKDFPASYRTYGALGDRVAFLSLFGEGYGEVVGLYGNIHHVRSGGSIFIQTWLHEKLWLDSYGYNERVLSRLVAGGT